MTSLRIALLVLLGTAGLRAADWTTDYEAALATAKEEDKTVLLNFTGSDWCGWCKLLKKEVFDTERFATWSADHVLVTVDFPRAGQQSDELKKQNRDLAKKYQVKGFPTIVFIDHEEKVLARHGYVKGGAEVWIAKAEELFDH